MKKYFILKDFVLVSMVTSIWVNISELVRYFGYVRPKMQAFFSHPQMGKIWDIQILAVWGFWDSLITCLYVFLFWLCAQVFGNSSKAIVISGVMSWCFVFVLYWVASANMFLAEWSNLLVVLPMALLETLVASFIASRLYMRQYDGAIR